MAIGKRWAGRVYGTNTGNVFLRLDGEDEALTGTLRVADDRLGVSVYDVAGTFDGTALVFNGEPRELPDGVVAGSITATGAISSEGTIAGDWESALGTGGTFLFHPHDRVALAEPDASDPEPNQLHTARYEFGALEVTKAQIVALAEQAQRELRGAPVIITVTAATEQARFLEDFKAASFPSKRARVVKIFARAPSVADFVDIITIEFGPVTNYVLAQSVREPWALGTVEMLKMSISPLQRTYATGIRRLGFSVPDLLIAWALVLLPDLSLPLRIALLALALVAVRVINVVHSRFIPLSTIWLGEKGKGLMDHLGPTMISWGVAFSSGLVVVIASAYVMGWLGLAPPIVPKL